MLKRTPLFETHRKLGGRLVEFGGWEMPVQYTGIMDEHNTVRTAAGLFDISHMGEVSVTGPGAAAFLNRVLTNDVNQLAVGQAQYTLMCNQRGGVLDDLYLYSVGASQYLLVINASRIEEDVAWLRGQLTSFSDRSQVVLQDRSAEFGAVAVQGPRVVEFMDTAFPNSITGTMAGKTARALKKNQIGQFDFTGQPVYIARTGYTGEDGFEVIAAANAIEAVWNRVLEIGRPFGLKPAGLGARDTLRTEMGYPLYGHELDEQTTPIEAGLGYFVALQKGEFIGRETLASQKAQGVAKKCVAFKMADKSAPPRPHYPIWSAGLEAQRIGEVVSGTQSPSLGAGIGMGYVPPQYAKPGTSIDIEIRGKRVAAVTANRPLFRKHS